MTTAHDMANQLAPTMARRNAEFAQQREIAAAKNVVRMAQANSKRYSVRALSLMTIGRGALQSALRYHG